MGLLAETAVAIGDAGTDLRHLRALRPYSARVAVCYAEISTGCVARNLGRMATVMERWDDAERHFADALETNERIGARPWLARTKHDYAEMLLARGGPGDSEKARSLEAQALAAYRELGMG